MYSTHFTFKVSNWLLQKQKIGLPIKEVSIVGHKDVWLCFLNVIKPPLNESCLQPLQRVIKLTETHSSLLFINALLLVATYLIVLIKNSEWPFVLRFGGKLKILNVLRDDLSVCDQKPLRENTRTVR